MKIFVLIIFIFFGACSKDSTYYSENCQLIDTISQYGYRSYGYKHRVSLSGIYRLEIYKCSTKLFQPPQFPMQNIITFDSIAISFDPDEEKLK